MGQRLNVEITKNGDILANAYYHWDAYTSTAVLKTERIIRDFLEIYGIPLKYYPDEITDLEIATRLLIMTGAGVNAEESIRIADSDISKRLIAEGIILPKSVNRSAGLIAVTKEGIEETRKWEEGRVTIDIGTKQVNFQVCSFCTKEEIDTYYDDVEASKFVECDFDISNLHFNDFLHGTVSKFVTAHPDGYKHGDDYILWIE